MLLPWLLAMLIALVPAAGLGAETTTEYRIKAAFLFNFAQFVRWPEASFASQDAPFVICVLGEDPFGSFLDEMVQDERVEGRPVVVARFSSVEETTGCQILYVSSAADTRWRTIAEQLAGHSVLTVADGDASTHRESIIRFTTEAGKIRLAVAIDEARAANLSISSKLLRTARVIEREKG